MKTQDGTADVLRDNTFLAESGMLPKVSSDALLCTLTTRVQQLLCL